MAREERHKSTHTGHLWDLHEARRYSEPPIDILTFRDWLEKHDFKVTKLEQNSLKAIGAQTPNLNWKPVLHYNWYQESPNSYVLYLRYSAKWKPVSSILAGIVTVGLSLLVGVGTFGSHISNAEQEFKEMWDEIERHRGVAAVETVTRSGFGQYEATLPKEYEEHLAALREERPSLITGISSLYLTEPAPPLYGTEVAGTTVEKPYFLSETPHRESLPTSTIEPQPQTQEAFVEPKPQEEYVESQPVLQEKYVESQPLPQEKYVESVPQDTFIEQRETFFPQQTQEGSYLRKETVVTETITTTGYGGEESVTSMYGGKDIPSTFGGSEIFTALEEEEVIIQGGTAPSLPVQIQRAFGSGSS